MSKLYASKDIPTGKEWMAGEGSEIPTPRFKFEDKKIQYNQKKAKHQNGCTVFGNLTALSALTGYEFSRTEQDEILDIAVKRGLNPNWGWITAKATDLVREYWNARFPDNKVITLREHVFGATWNKLVDKGYQYVVSAQLTTPYWNDVFSDGELDYVPDERGYYGHVFSGYEKNKDLQVMVENYYGGKKFNTYEVEGWEFKELHSRLRENKVKYLPANYFFVFEDDFKAANNGELKVSTWAEEAVKKYSWVFDDFIPKREVNMERFQHVLNKLGLLKEVGVMTEERVCVLLDRLLD